MKIKIDKKDILNNEGKVLVSGLTTDNPEGINYTNSGMILRFVLKIGHGNDWTVYIGRESQTEDEISKIGDKVIPHALKNIFEFDNEVEGMFRF